MNVVFDDVGLLGLYRPARQGRQSWEFRGRDATDFGMGSELLLHPNYIL